MLKRTLVANRGEIACRILRACREAGIEGVAIYAANDAGTLFTELADISVQLEEKDLLRPISIKHRFYKLQSIQVAIQFIQDSDSCQSVQISLKQ